MTVRDPGFDPRRQHPRSDARPASAHAARPTRSARPARPAWFLPALVAIALTLVVGVGIGIGGGVLSGSSKASPAALGALGAATVTPAPGSTVVPPNAPSNLPASTAPAAGTPTPDPSPSLVLADVAIVPVTSFRSARVGVVAADVKAIAAGSGAFAALVLVEPDADPIMAALGLDRSAFGKRLVTVGSAAELASNLAANRTRIGFLRADEVNASVRALDWGGKAMFGVGRVASLAAWPLKAKLPAVGAVAAYDPATAWTLFAGGDMLLDRGVSLAIQASAHGADFPFDGGTATITSRYCCSSFGWNLPRAKRTGGAGSVRDLISGADLAIANFENPAPNAFHFHAKGTVFSANPKYIAGLRDAGIDWVSLANNHIGDAGRNGILQTMANLDRYGIAHSGAGKNTADAHKASLLKAGGVTVGILAYDTIAGYYQSGASTPGSARMTAAALKADIAAARKAGADLVVVFPHWGVEYRATPTAGQKSLAHAAIDAGADLVIGNHPHWAGGMEVYKGKPIWYALGNFVFDQTWSEPTMEGITLELTFRGTQLVQARMRPHLILDRAQPNFMDPAGAGKVVVDQVFGASKGLLGW